MKTEIKQRDDDDDHHDRTDRHSNDNSTTGTTRRPYCFVTLFVPTLFSAGFVIIILVWSHHHHHRHHPNSSQPGSSLDHLSDLQPQQQQQQPHQQNKVDAEASVQVQITAKEDQLKVEETEQDDDEPSSWRYYYHMHDKNKTCSSRHPRQLQQLRLSHPHRFAFVHKSVIIPHDSKLHRGGEDSATTSPNLLVVADGVGGWASRGVNPGLFSRMLTTRIVELFSDSETPPTTPQQLSQIIHQANIETGRQHLGSATCTAVMISSSPSSPSTTTTQATSSKIEIEIQTLNIGDSGYSIHRKHPNTTNTGKHYDVVYASTPGQKRFNFPHQLGGERHGDAVNDVADCNTHLLEENDVVVIYSDGVSDNLRPQQYHTCFERYDMDLHLDSESESDSTTSTTSKGVRLVSYSVVADCIARCAYELGKNKTFDSPFAQGARSVGKQYAGGKHDDITVVVAQIVATAVHDDDGEDTDDSKSTATAATTLTSMPTDPSSDRYKMETMVDDPYRPESIFLYTDQVGSKDDLPTLGQLISKKKNKNMSVVARKNQKEKLNAGTGHAVPDNSVGDDEL